MYQFSGEEYELRYDFVFGSKEVEKVGIDPLRVLFFLFIVLILVACIVD